MAVNVESQKSILNTTRDAAAWMIEENRFRRQGVPEFPRESSLWVDGTVNKNALNPNDICKPAKFPYRDYEGTSDPTSGFVSAGGDVIRKTGVQKIDLDAPSRPRTARIAQDVLREQFARYRKVGYPPQGVERGIDCVTKWSSKKADQGYLRAEIAGFVTNEEEKRRIPNQIEMDPNSKKLKKSLAHRYTWTSIQRRAYDNVDWDRMLPEKSCVFPVSYERTADPVSLTFKKSAGPQPSTDYQRMGDVWDKPQLRQGYYSNRPHTFVSVMPRSGQLVGYAGEIGTLGDPVDKDNPYICLSKHLLTKKRSDIPGLTYTSASPHVPGYTGVYHIKPKTRTDFATAGTTSADVHRHIPLEADRVDFGHKGPLSGMVTTVPPQNPFKAIPDAKAEPMSMNEMEKLASDICTDKKQYGLENTLQL